MEVDLCECEIPKSGASYFIIILIILPTKCNPAKEISEAHDNIQRWNRPAEGFLG